MLEQLAVTAGCLSHMSCLMGGYKRRGETIIDDQDAALV